MIVTNRLKTNRSWKIVNQIFHDVSIRRLSGNSRETTPTSASEFAEIKKPLLELLINTYAADGRLPHASNTSPSSVPAYCNIPPHIAKRVGTQLHLRKNHPLNIIKSKIERYWLHDNEQSNASSSFRIFDDFHPLVRTHDNFDSLLIPKDHVSRSKSDTYYLDEETVLRTHTSAHQLELLQVSREEDITNHSFLVSGDVFRRDEIDSSHYPIFHQMEGVRLFDRGTSSSTVEHDLMDGLEGMAKVLFGNVEMRWVDAYFPFTSPSLELEIYFEGEWLEVLGCGVIEKNIIRAAGRIDQPGWAFGLGLERLAMVLFGIPDIRLFWTNDQRFHEQFSDGEIVKFKPYSKYPPCLKDISFWTNNSFHANDLNEVIRDIAGDLVERVELIDEFKHPKTNRNSNCFRITYRSMDRSLTNHEIDVLQEKVRERVVKSFGLELR